jgi:hypothetical protein
MEFREGRLEAEQIAVRPETVHPHPFGPVAGSRDSAALKAATDAPHVIEDDIAESDESQM